MAGSTINLTEPGVIELSSNVSSQYALDRFEVIYNGQVAYSHVFDEPTKTVRLREQIDVPRSGWIAVRAGGPSHADQPGGNVFGHTSPVYVDVKDKPIDAKADAEYFVNWIDRLRTDVRRRNRIPSRHQVDVESQIAEARQIFNNLLQP